MWSVTWWVQAPAVPCACDTSSVLEIPARVCPQLRTWRWNESQPKLIRPMASSMHGEMDHPFLTRVERQMFWWFRTAAEQRVFREKAKKIGNL